MKSEEFKIIVDKMEIVRDKVLEAKQASYEFGEYIKDKEYEEEDFTIEQMKIINYYADEINEIADSMFTNEEVQ